MIAPLTAGVGMAPTIGAGATAQLGAMRIDEEIDALEVIGIRTVGYLASARFRRRRGRGDSAVVLGRAGGVFGHPDCLSPS